jgi:hypothetical protein
MAKASTLGYQAFWANKRAALQAVYQAQKDQNPDGDAQYRQTLKVLCEIEDTASFTPGTVGESPEWASIVDSAEENAATFCKALSGKPLFSALHGTYTVALGQLKALFKKSIPGQRKETLNTAGPSSAPDDGFQEVRRRKRQSSGETDRTSKKPVLATPTPKVPTRNIFAPLRTMNMKTESHRESDSYSQFNHS